MSGTGFNDDGVFIDNKKINVQNGRLVYDESNVLAFTTEVSDLSGDYATNSLVQSVSADLQSQIDTNVSDINDLETYVSTISGDYLSVLGGNISGNVFFENGAGIEIGDGTNISPLGIISPDSFNPVSDFVFYSTLASDTFPRLIMYPDGRMVWSDGTFIGDAAALEREGNGLKLTGALETTQDITAGADLYVQGNIVNSALQSDLDGKADTSHTHVEADITDLGDYATNSEVASVTGSLDSRITTIENDYVTSTEVANVTGDLQSQITTNAGNISTNASDISDLQSDVAGISGVVDTKVDRSGDTMTGALSVPDLTVTNDATVNGNLYVNGTEFIVNTESVSAKDNQIVINAGEVGAGVTAGYAGIRVYRGTLDPYDFQFRNSDETFVIGVSGDYQAVATREDTPLAGGYAKWNDTSNRFDSVSVATISGDLGLDSKVDVAGDSMTGPLIINNVGSGTDTFGLRVSSSGGTGDNYGIEVIMEGEEGTNYAARFGAGILIEGLIENTLGVVFDPTPNVPGFPANENVTMWVDTNDDLRYANSYVALGASPSGGLLTPPVSINNGAQVDNSVFSVRGDSANDSSNYTVSKTEFGSGKTSGQGIYYGHKFEWLGSGSASPEVHGIEWDQTLDSNTFQNVYGTRIVLRDIDSADDSSYVYRGGLFEVTVDSTSNEAHEITGIRADAVENLGNTGCDVIGVYGNSNCPEGTSYGGRFASNSENATSYGVYADATTTNGTAYGLYATANLGLLGSGTIWAGWFEGDTKINGNLSLSSGTTVNEISVDGTLSGNSDDVIPTEQAVKTYVDAASGNLQTQIDSIQTEVEGLSANIFFYQGSEECNTSTNIYTITHAEVDVSATVPQVSLSVPTSSALLYATGTTNRTTTSFDVVLSGTPGVTGYTIDWRLIEGITGMTVGSGSSNNITTITDNSSAATYDNVNIGGSSLVEVEGVSGSNITVTGFSNGNPGNNLNVTNTGNGFVNLPNEDSGSISENQIQTSSGNDFIIGPGETAQLTYNGNNKWYVLTNTPGGIFVVSTDSGEDYLGGFENLIIGNASTIHFAVTTSIDLEGVAGGYDGRRLTLVLTENNTEEITVRHGGSVSTLAGNEFDLPGDVDRELNNSNIYMELVYFNNRWNWLSGGVL